MSSVSRPLVSRVSPRSVELSRHSLRISRVRPPGKSVSEFLGCRELRPVASRCVTPPSVSRLSYSQLRRVVLELVRPSSAGLSPRSVLAGALSKTKKAASERIVASVVGRLAALGPVRPVCKLRECVASVAFSSRRIVFPAKSGAEASLDAGRAGAKTLH